MKLELTKDQVDLLLSIIDNEYDLNEELIYSLDSIDKDTCDAYDYKYKLESLMRSLTNNIYP